MKTESQTNLECLRIATVLASAKAIKPSDAVKYAKEFYDCVNGSDGSARDEIERLRAYDEDQNGRHSF